MPAYRTDSLDCSQFHTSLAITAAIAAIAKNSGTIYHSAP